jgi:hypothetical protein
MTRRDVLFLKTTEQLAEVRARRPELLESSEVVALSLAGWLALRDLGVEAQAASDYLEGRDILEIQSEASMLARTWYAPFRESMIHEGLDLGELCRIENLWFFWELLAANRVARRVVEALQPSRAFIFASRGAPCLRIHRVRATHSVCEATIVEFLCSAGVRTTNLTRVDRGRWPFVPLKYKRWLRQFVSDLGGKRNPRAPEEALGQEADAELVRPVRKPGSRLILAVGEEVDLLSLAPVADLLNSSSGYTAALANSDRRILETAVRSGLSTIRTDDVYPMLDAFPIEATPEIREQLERARRQFDATRDSGVCGFGNRLLDDHFDAVWEELGNQVVPHIDRVTATLEEIRPDGVLVAGCELPKDRATVAVARRLGIVTLAVPHGYIGNIAAFDFDTDCFLAWGTASRECLVAELGKDPGSIDVFGPPHLVTIVPPDRSPAPAGRCRLLALASRISPACFDHVEAAAFDRAWTALMDWVASRSDVDLAIRPHSGGADVVDYYERLIARLPAGRAWLEQSRRLEDMADEVDAVVAMIDATTAILVAQQLGLPTVFVRVGWRAAPWAVRTWGLPEGLASVDSVDEVPRALDRLVDDKAFRRECAARGRALVTRNFEPYSALGPTADLSAILDRRFSRRHRTADGAVAKS